MEAKTLLEKIKRLPREAQSEAIDFIDFLEQKYTEEKKKEIDWDVIVGMWADREDMQDSIKWVREIREKGWRSK